jgi:hypothetical protein
MSTPCPASPREVGAYFLCRDNRIESLDSSAPPEGLLAETGQVQEGLAFLWPEGAAVGRYGDRVGRWCHV